MVPREWLHHLASACGEHSSAVADVGDVAGVSHDEGHDGAGTRSLNEGGIPILVGGEAHLHEAVLSFLEALENGLLRVPGEAVLLDYEVMQVVPQELSTCVASMAIVDAEEGTLRPVFVLSVFGLHDVQDDADAILIVVPHQSLIGVGCISPNYSVALHAALSGFVVRDDDSSARLQRQFL